MEVGRYFYSTICSIIKENLIQIGISNSCIEVLYDSIEQMYIVKIKNMMGEAEYRQAQQVIFFYGVKAFTDMIKRDYILPKGVEE